MAKRAIQWLPAGVVVVGGAMVLLGTAFKLDALMVCGLGLLVLGLFCMHPEDARWVEDSEDTQ